MNIRTTMPSTTPIIIDAEKPSRVLDLGELWRYRGLIGLFIRRNLVTRTKQSVLGPLWLVLVPLITTLVFTVVFNRMAGLPTEEHPPFLFYLAGVTAWTFFSGSFQQTASFFVDNLSLLSKVYFPRLCLPLSILGTQLVTFFVQISVFLLIFGTFILFGSLPDWHVSILPFLAGLAQLSLLALGSGLLVASATVKYRDLLHILGFFVNLWLYATPIIYPGSMIPSSWRWLLVVNPAAAPVELIRQAFLPGSEVGGAILLTSWLLTLAIFILGVRAYLKVERTFVDTL